MQQQSGQKLRICHSWSENGKLQGSRGLKKERVRRAFAPARRISGCSTLLTRVYRVRGLKKRSSLRTGITGQNYGGISFEETFFKFFFKKNWVVLGNGRITVILRGARMGRMPAAGMGFERLTGRARHGDEREQGLSNIL